MIKKEYCFCFLQKKEKSYDYISPRNPMEKKFKTKFSTFSERYHKCLKISSDDVDHALSVEHIYRSLISTLMFSQIKALLFLSVSNIELRL